MYNNSIYGVLSLVHCSQDSVSYNYHLCIYISTHTISLIVLSTSSAGNTIIQATHVPYLEVMHGGYHPQPSLTNHGSMYPNHSITPYQVSLGGGNRLYHHQIAG